MRFNRTATQRPCHDCRALSPPRPVRVGNWADRYETISAGFILRVAHANEIRLAFRPATDDTQVKPSGTLA